MKKRIDNRPVGDLKRIEDFLPPPEILMLGKESRKVTILLDEEIVNFFKLAAQKSDSKYQQIIREVLRRYVEQYSKVS